MFCLTHYKERLQSTKLTSSGTPIFRKTPHSKHGNAIYFPLILPTGTVCPFVPGTSSKLVAALELTTLHLRLPEAPKHWGETSKSPPYTLQEVKGKRHDSESILLIYAQANVHITNLPDEVCAFCA